MGRGGEEASLLLTTFSGVEILGKVALGVELKVGTSISIFFVSGVTVPQPLKAKIIEMTAKFVRYSKILFIIQSFLSKSTLFFQPPPSISGKERAMANCPATFAKNLAWPLMK